jgi:hypothetical protein
VGTGQRTGIDRDRDGALDGDESMSGTDPGDPSSHPLLGVGGSSIATPGLRAVWPNPFRANATVDYTLPRGGAASVAVYDVLGREVRMLARSSSFTPGLHSVSWDGRATDGHSAATGVYFVRLKTDAGSWQRTVIRIR